MIRLAGILLGSTLAVAMLLALFGVPRFEPQSTPSDSGVITLPLQSAVSKAVPARRTDSRAETTRADTAEPEVPPAEPTPRQAAETPAELAAEPGDAKKRRSGFDAPETSLAESEPVGARLEDPGQGLAESEPIGTRLEDPGQGLAEPEPVDVSPGSPGRGLPASEPIGTLQWYAFWSPFRSEIAATGFITQLQRVTGLDYRVVKIKPGVYEVAFAYSDDDELTASLSQISRAAGLDMPDE